MIFTHLIDTLQRQSGSYRYFSLEKIEREGLAHLDSLTSQIFTPS
jgi:hypothetical protein